LTDFQNSTTAQTTLIYSQQASLRDTPMDLLSDQPSNAYSVHSFFVFAMVIDTTSRIRGFLPLLKSTKLRGFHWQKSCATTQRGLSLSTKTLCFRQIKNEHFVMISQESTSMISKKYLKIHYFCGFRP